MGRYVKEFANATMLGEKYAKRAPFVREMNGRIRRILNAHEKGLITDYEAVKCIVNIAEQYKAQ